jgi:hypothetical protein
MSYNIGAQTVNALGQKMGGGARTRIAGAEAGLTDDKRTAVDKNDFGLNDKRFDSLSYPITMTPENFYPEVMCFTIKKRVGLSVDDVAKIVGDVYKERVGKNKQVRKNAGAMRESINNSNYGDGGFGPLTAADEAQRQEDLADVLTYEKEHLGNTSASNVLGDLVGGAKDIAARTSAEKSRLTASAARTHANVLGHIYLNMPKGIQFENDANWNATGIGNVGALAKSVMGGDGGGGAALGGAAGHAGTIAGATIGGTIGFLADKLSIPSGTGVGALTGAFAGGSGIQGALDVTLGMASNPYEEMMFSGVTFRSFSFDFIFRPQSADEIKEVDSIIKAFRRHSRPSFSKGAFGKSVMDYPMEFDIQFLTAEMGKPKLRGNDAMDDAAGGDIVYTTNTHLPLIKTCVCDKVSTNYTPNGAWSAYAAGAPIAITMGLGFKEKELVMEEDIAGGH